MSRPAWMDQPHEFRENRNDYSMCQCGVPLSYHDEWEQRQTLIDAVQDVVVSTLNTVGSNLVGSHFTPLASSPIPDDEVARMFRQTQISDEGVAVIKSGLSVRQAHEIKTGCSTANPCGNCRRYLT